MGRVVERDPEGDAAFAVEDRDRLEVVLFGECVDDEIGGSGEVGIVGGAGCREDDTGVGGALGVAGDRRPRVELDGVAAGDEPGHIVQIEFEIGVLAGRRPYRDRLDLGRRRHHALVVDGLVAEATRVRHGDQRGAAEVPVHHQAGALIVGADNGVFGLSD